VSGMEFSNVVNANYYYAKVQSVGQNANLLTLEFYKGNTDGSPASTGLNVSVAVDTENYTPLVWHLLPV